MFQRRGRCLAIVPVMAGRAFTVGNGEGGGQPTWAEAAAVAAVGLQNELRAPLMVDPHPVNVPAEFHVPSHSAYRDDVTPEGLTTLLHDAGMQTARALPLRSGCTGLMVPPPHKETQNCPTSLELHGVFDLVQEHQGRPTVMSAVIGYQPEGRFISIRRIWLRKTADGYEYDHAESLFAVD